MNTIGREVEQLLRLHHANIYLHSDTLQLLGNIDCHRSPFFVFDSALCDAGDEYS